MKIIVTPQAEKDRHRIWMFQADRNIAYADRVNVRFEQRLVSLASLPRQGRPVRGNMRQLAIPDIQLVLRYRIDEDAIRILRVWHSRENRYES